MLMHVYHSFEE